MSVKTVAPIDDIDSVDIVGVRKDGGLDMVISTRGPIDESPGTLDLLEKKILNYLNGAMSESFLNQYGRSVGVPIAIYLSCAYPISKPALDVIEKLRRRASQHGIGLEIQDQMS